MKQVVRLEANKRIGKEARWRRPNGEESAPGDSRV